MNTAMDRKRKYSMRLLAASLIGSIGLATATLGIMSASAASPEEPLKTRMASLQELGFPAVLATVTDAQGHATGVAVGVGDISTGAPAPVNGQVRIGSNTKTFVAVVIMQLVEESKVQLDEPIETYLPGLIKGDGIDGSKITVRQLLQHTSGLPEYADLVAGEGVDFVAIRNDYMSPRDLLDAALARPAQFEPGAKFTYTNTNYLVAGLLVEKVTKRTVNEQIDERIVQPLGLKNTYLPNPGERGFRGEHPHGYHPNAKGEQTDITEMDTSVPWAAGAMISTPGELNRFMQAIEDGTLVSAESLAEIHKSVPAAELGGEYGLGLIKRSLSCGDAWGHGGTIEGYETHNAVGSDGTAATIALTSVSGAASNDPEGVYKRVEGALDTTLCGE